MNLHIESYIINSFNMIARLDHCLKQEEIRIILRSVQSLGRRYFFQYHNTIQ